ncbi:MAG: response regulator [Deltaproteobacteria bacterium]|nr:response regulator [Deltaproteobacteria bacterium]
MQIVQNMKKPETGWPTMSTNNTKDSSAPKKQAITILVVDDEEMNRDMLSRRLAWSGYRTIVAASGPEALERMAQQPVDIVLLDIMMPDMTGIEVLAEIRRNHSPAELPVIMATAKSETDDVVEALRGGANDYVTKPLNFPIVLARVGTQANLKAATEALAKSETRYRLLTEQSADLIMLHDPDGQIRFASQASYEILEYAPEEMVGKPIREFFHPRDRNAIPRSHADLPDVCTVIIRMRKADGNHVWVEMVTRSLRDERSGEVRDIQTTTRDISMYVTRASGSQPPAAGGADFINNTGWRVPDEEHATEDLPPPRVHAPPPLKQPAPMEELDLLGDDGPTIVAHEDAAVRANIEEMVKTRKPRRRRSLVKGKVPRRPAVP